MEKKTLTPELYNGNPTQRIFMSDGIEIFNVVPVLDSKSKRILALAGSYIGRNQQEDSMLFKYSPFDNAFAPAVATHRKLTVEVPKDYPKLVRHKQYGFIVLAHRASHNPSLSANPCFIGTVLESNDSHIDNPEVGYNGLNFLVSEFEDCEIQEITLKF